MQIIPGDVAPAQVASLGRNSSPPSISQLPFEMLVWIFRLALPDVRCLSRYKVILPRSYMRMLDIMRFVTRHWRAVIDETPSFWTTVVCTFPPHVNKSSILRSLDLPLFVICEYPELPQEVSPSAEEFLEAVAYTRPRWSAIYLGLYNPQTMSRYIREPAPLLQTIIVEWTTDQIAEPMELLGGATTNLRHVDLAGIPIYWPIGCFTRLKYLSLGFATHDHLTGSHLLTILRASPGLEVLEIRHYKTTIPPMTPPSLSLPFISFGTSLSMAATST